ncbi:Thiol:disulfide interchange protein dsbC precursor, putative, partial [Ricinus communis]
MPRRFLKRLSVAAALVGAMCSGLAVAADAPEAVIKTTLEAARPDAKVQSVVRSEMPGLYTVKFVNGPQVYATPDGKYFVLGDLYQVEQKGFVNLAEQKRNGERAKLLADLKPEDMIIFKPKGETKAAITVFTDVDCGYCRKLHKEVPQLNAMGIEVRYLAYPRAGI